MTPDPVTPEAVIPLLLASLDPCAPWVAGIPLEYLASCPSTNAELKGRVAGSRTGTTLVTDDQTGGRGRSGRTWISAPGADLTFSVLLRPRLAPESGHLLSLATGVAVADVLEEVLGLRGAVSLKWPNDVLLGGKKVCGVLLEASVEAGCFRWAIAGVGVNVNSQASRLPESRLLDKGAEWRGRPAPISLKEYLGYAVKRAPLLAALLARLTRCWTALEDGADGALLLDEWRRRDALRGSRVEVFAGADRSDVLAAGEAIGVGREGQLLVRGDDGAVVEVFAGDVSVSRQM